MKAENQSLLLEAAAGQQAVQAMFVHPAENLNTPPKVLNLNFERDPEDGLWYFIYEGTAENYVAFRQMMIDGYDVWPAHEKVGNRFCATPAEGEAQEQRTVETDAGKPEGDTFDDMEELTLEAVDESTLHANDAGASNGGQPASGGAGQAGTARTGDQSAQRSGNAPAANRSSGGEAAGKGASSTVNSGSKVAAKDPFEGLV